MLPEDRYGVSVCWPALTASLRHAATARDSDDNERGCYGGNKCSQWVHSLATSTQWTKPDRKVARQGLAPENTLLAQQCWGRGEGRLPTRSFSQQKSLSF